MRKKISKIIVLTLLASLIIGVAAPVTYAQPDPTSKFNSLAQLLRNPVGVVTSGVSALQCGIGNVSACFALVGEFILGAAASILFVAGKTFDIAVNYTINFARVMTDVPVVDIGWTIFRDLANLVFIFILLWIAIQTILGISSGQTKKLLGGVIVVAILINFSLFITKVIVDASNIVALHFYSEIKTATGKDGSITAGFMEGLALTTLYDPNAASIIDIVKNPSEELKKALPRVAGQITQPTRFAMITISGAVMMIIAAFVFFVGAILFIIRAVGLMFLMMLSPLAFVGHLLPGPARSLAGRWWSMLWSQAFFAPIYLILASIVVFALQTTAFKERIQPKSGNVYQTLAALYTGDDAPITLLINFIFLIILLVGCLIVAKQMGAWGSAMVIRWGHSAQRGITGAATGFAGRHTVGHAARSFEEYAQTSPFWSKPFGTKIREWTTQPLSQAKFGGKISAWEMKKREKVRATGEIEARRLQELMIEARKGEKADPRILEDQAIRLAPATLANLDMRYLRQLPIGILPDTHWQALMASDKVQKDKDELAMLRFKPAQVVRDKIRAEAVVTAVLQKFPRLAETYYGGGGLRLFLKQEAGETLSPQEQEILRTLSGAGVSWSQRQDQEFKPAFEFLRAKSPKELGQLNRVDPKAINELSQALNWGPQIGPLRKSDDLTFDQRNGQQGEQLRDYKDKLLLDALDIMYGIKIFREEAGKLISRSLKERYVERQKLTRVLWKARQYGTVSIEDPTHPMHGKYTAEEKEAWQKLKDVNPEERALGHKLFEQHHEGRSDSELTLGRTYMRNDPINFASLGPGSVPSLLDRDNDKKEEQGGQLLTSLAEDTLTEQNKQFAVKVFWDRNADLFLKNWGEIAARNGLAGNPIIQKILEWKKEGSKGKDKFMKYIKTIGHKDFYPGSNVKGGTDWAAILRGGGDEDEGGGTGGGGGRGGGAPSRAGGETPEDRRRRGGAV